MKHLLRALAAAAWLTGGSASAANLCNCCATGTAAACATACADAKPVEGLCLPAVDFEGAANIGPGQNPLYEVPLKSLNLAGTKREGLEAFRGLLEMSRKGVEKDRRVALRDFRKNLIDAAAASTAAKRYDDAMVNYYLGMNAYRRAFQH
jgi:hypothetical protein